MVASTWLGDHQGRPSAPLIRCVKPSKYGALTNTLELDLELYYYYKYLLVRLHEFERQSHLRFFTIVNDLTCVINHVTITIT